MSCNHAKLLEQARAAGLSEDELDVMAEELQHDPGAEETEDEQELIPKIAPIKRKRQAPKSKKFVEENTRVFCYSTAWHILYSTVILQHLRSQLKSSRISYQSPVLLSPRRKSTSVNLSLVGSSFFRANHGTP